MARIHVEIENRPGDATTATPAAFVLLGRTFRVREVIDRWRGSDHAYFKLVADDGNLYVIRHDLESDTWEMVMMEAGGHA